MHLYRPRSRRLRRRERARRRRFLAGVIITTVLIAVSLAKLSRTPRIPAEPPESGPESLVAIATEPVEAGGDTGREPVVFPYSIIPGGAANAGALREAIAADPVVRAHYANFDLSRTRVVRLTEPRVAHVSYRIGDDVFWTKKPLLLKAGETLLTDGEHYARTRCGNQLAASPGPVSADEPPDGAFDSPLQRLQGGVWVPPIPPVSATTGSPGPGADPPGPVFIGGGFPFPTGAILAGDPGGTRTPIAAAPPPAIVSGAAPIDGQVFPPIVIASIPPPGDPGDPPPGTDDPDPPQRPRILNDPPGGGNTRQVPEPQLLMLIGTGGLAWLGRRVRKKRNAGPGAGILLLRADGR
jgi:hypothetical protein